ncbi:hypothetical protein ACOMHN_004897 [Nucella lapillus]
MAAIMCGNRGGNVLVYRHFRYHKHRSSGNFINWRCWRRNCRAKLRTNQFDEEEDHPNIPGASGTSVSGRSDEALP